MVFGSYALTFLFPQESGYEAIFYDKDIFYVVRESVEMLDESRRAQTYNAVIEELSIAGRDYEVLAACPSEFEFEGTRYAISCRFFLWY